MGRYQGRAGSLFLAAALALSGCAGYAGGGAGAAETAGQAAGKAAGKAAGESLRKTGSADAAEDPAENLVDASGSTLKQRFRVPEGYRRVSCRKGSFQQFLRRYRMKPDGSPVLLYNGKEKNGDFYAAVFSMKLVESDLQQCADSVMRMYAEYLRASGQEEKIAFHFVSGFLCDWKNWKAGKRVSVSGSQVSWYTGADPSGGDTAFEQYLRMVFAYAGTPSLAAESEPVSLADLQAGDIFIHAGSPGHVVMVVDVCERDGKKAFLLAQGFMPAQEFHVLANPAHCDGAGNDPWYYEEEVSYPFYTPQYTFEEGSLMRPGYLGNPG